MFYLHNFFLFHLGKISPLVLGEVFVGQGKVRRGSRKCVLGVKEKCVDFCRFSNGHHTFIWAKSVVQSYLNIKYLV